MNQQHLGIGMTSQRTRERLVQRLQEKGVSDSQVLDVMRNTPRHIFVDEALSSRAYEDTALPIGYGQTISQPYIVARMTEIVMQVEPVKVLEIGTGCGYQTAVLASLIRDVYTIERIAGLLDKARKHLRELNLRNVRTRLGDGFQGWPQAAPFDAIMAAAAPSELPVGLLEQLSEGGRMVMPVGDHSGQQLISITRHGGEYHQEVLEKVMFVPMLSGIKR